MSKPFPQDALLQENFAPVMAECDAPDLVVVEGEILEIWRARFIVTGRTRCFRRLPTSITGFSAKA